MKIVNPSKNWPSRVNEKRNADFVKSLTAFVRERMAGIVSESKKGEIFYNGESVFNSYFDNERFNAFASLKKHSIMIITGCNNEDVAFPDHRCHSFHSFIEHKIPA